MDVTEVRWSFYGIINSKKQQGDTEKRFMKAVQTLRCLKNEDKKKHHSENEAYQTHKDVWNTQIFMSNKWLKVDKNCSKVRVTGHRVTDRNWQHFTVTDYKSLTPFDANL
jgi:acetate kinase